MVYLLLLKKVVRKKCLVAVSFPEETSCGEIIKLLKLTKYQGLKFVPFNLDNVRLVLLTNDSFENAPDVESN